MANRTLIKILYSVGAFASICMQAAGDDDFFGRSAAPSSWSFGSAAPQAPAVYGPNWGSGAWDTTCNIVSWPVRFAWGKMSDLAQVVCAAGPDAGRFAYEHKAEVGLGTVTVAAVLALYYYVNDNRRVQELKRLLSEWVAPLAQYAEDPRPDNRALIDNWLALDAPTFDATVQAIERNLGILGVKRGSLWSFYPGMYHKVSVMDDFIIALRALRASGGTVAAAYRDRFNVIMHNAKELLWSALNSAEREAIKKFEDDTRRAREEREVHERNRRLEESLLTGRGGGHGGGAPVQQHGGQMMGGNAPVIVNMPPPVPSAPPLYMDLRAYQAWQEQQQPPRRQLRQIEER